MAKLPRANKDLGQHFLTDKSVISKITNDAPSDFDAIVEIGPGPAVLSKDLATYDVPYYAIDLDSRFRDYLLPLTSKENIFIEDALKFDWSKIAQERIWLVSNLPYNISSQLLISFLTISKISAMTLMYQKEVGEKTFQRDVKNTMSSLLALSTTYFEAKSLCKVLPGAFSPPPKVDSVVVSYQRKTQPIIPLSEFKTFETFLRTLFAQRRKQIRANLKGKYKDTFEKALQEASVDQTRRAETLSLSEIHQIYNAL
jgi:16S rRNA (adenine1518-N6/adenine1519-N6)-dimethyltransferase